MGGSEGGLVTIRLNPNHRVYESTYGRHQGLGFAPEMLRFLFFRSNIIVGKDVIENSPLASVLATSLNVVFDFSDLLYKGL